MPNRRQVLHQMWRLWSAALTLTGIDMIRGGSVLAAVKKRLVPAHADPQRLRNADPEHLDTRQLPIMPLQRFDTMGEETAPFDPQLWRLTIDGQVRRPLSFSYPAVRKRPAITRKVLLICPGVFVNHGSWKGISLGDLLGEAAPLTEAKAVVIWTQSGTRVRKERFDLAEVYADRVFLAYGVNGQDLPEKHGYPLRVVAEGHYGDTWAKYVNRVEVR
jgi:sulfoxide reductase catalytic subunit YedY